MKKIIFYLAILMLSLNGLNAAALNKLNFIDTTRTPVVFVGALKTSMKQLVINLLSIKSVDVFKDSIATKAFGEAGKNGVVVIHPKPNILFLRVDKILDEYKISGEDRKLRICINKILIRETQLILIESTEIEKVEVTTDWNWKNVEDANSGEKCINITTITRKKVASKTAG